MLNNALRLRTPWRCNLGCKCPVGESLQSYSFWSPATLYTSCRSKPWLSAIWGHIGMSTESFHGTSYSISRLWKPAQPHCWGLEVLNNPGNPQSDGTKAEWKTQWRLPLDQELLAAQMIYRCDVISREGQRINDGNYIRIQDLDVPWFVNIYPHLVWEWLRCAGIILHLSINPDFVVSIERSWYCQWNLAKVWCRIIMYHWYIYI